MVVRCEPPLFESRRCETKIHKTIYERAWKSVKRYTCVHTYRNTRQHLFFPLHFTFRFIFSSSSFSVAITASCFLFLPYAFIPLMPIFCVGNTNKSISTEIFFLFILRQPYGIHCRYIYYIPTSCIREDPFKFYVRTVK